MKTVPLQLGSKFAYSDTNIRILPTFLIGRRVRGKSLAKSAFTESLAVCKIHHQSLHFHRTVCLLERSRMLDVGNEVLPCAIEVLPQFFRIDLIGLLANGFFRRFRKLFRLRVRHFYKDEAVLVRDELLSLKADVFRTHDLTPSISMRSPMPIGRFPSGGCSFHCR